MMSGTFGGEIQSSLRDDLEKNITVGEDHSQPSIEMLGYCQTPLRGEHTFKSFRGERDFQSLRGKHNF